MIWSVEYMTGKTRKICHVNVKSIWYVLNNNIMFGPLVDGAEAA
jgi:hypothetical protein